MIRKFKCTNIDWDADDPEDVEDLPIECELKLNVCKEVSDDELEDLIGDYLSDTYGFCHNGFTYVEI